MWATSKVFIEFVTILLLCYVSVLGHEACGILVPRPGIEPVPVHWEVNNHRTTREVLGAMTFMLKPEGEDRSWSVLEEVCSRRCADHRSLLSERGWNAWRTERRPWGGWGYRDQHEKKERDTKRLQQRDLALETWEARWEILDSLITFQTLVTILWASILTQAWPLRLFKNYYCASVLNCSNQVYLFFNIC